jgi:hypothetical protein
MDASPARNDRWAIAGYVFAVLLPLIGLIIGVVLNNRQDPRGIRIVWLACVMIALGIAVRVALA